MESAIAGFLGSASAGIFYPLEVIKVHLMIADGRSKNYTPHYHHSLHVLKNLYATGGIARLYRGWYLSTANSLAWGVYFFFYQSAKDYLQGPLAARHHELTKFAVAFQASVITTALVNPVMVLKTRVMLLKYHQNWHQDITDTFSKLWKLEGVKGFYSGLVPALFLSLNGTLHMYFYETLKETFNRENNNTKTTLIGAFSKLFSSVLLHPFQTLKYRLQQEQHSNFIMMRSAEIAARSDIGSKLFVGLKQCAVSTYQHEGFRGFYKGLLINQIRLFPSNALFFLVYENTLKFFHSDSFQA